MTARGRVFQGARKVTHKNRDMQTERYFCCCCYDRPPLIRVKLYGDSVQREISGDCNFVLTIFKRTVTYLFLLGAVYLEAAAVVVLESQENHHNHNEPHTSSSSTSNNNGISKGLRFLWWCSNNNKNKRTTAASHPSFYL